MLTGYNQGGGANQADHPRLISELFIVLCTLAWTATASAFSDPLTYGTPAIEGGGGGRWFTGSRADGHACDVCHDGGDAIDVEVSGLPLNAYVPGATYEVTLSWAQVAPHVALVAEFTDDRNAGAGLITPPSLETIGTEEFCMEEGTLTQPALQLYAAQRGRTLAAVVDCGAAAVRFLWSAPTTEVGTIWFNAGVVSADQETDAAGDGVTLVRRPLGSRREPYDAEIAHGCSSVEGRAPKGGSSFMTGSALAVAVLLTAWARLRRGS